MLKCSYILYVHNNEETIHKVIDSLAKINGNFRKEFIIIDDGSSDQSLQVIKNHIKVLPRATVITQEHSGSAISINKAISLVKADYVHFVSAKCETDLYETEELINACGEYKAEVAFYLEPSHNKVKAKTNKIEIVEQPLAAILAGDKFSNIRNIGEAGSLVGYNLLIEIDGADESVYSVNPSLALRCAGSTKFICIGNEHNNLKQSNVEVVSNLSFEIYNQMLAIYRFMQEKPDLCKTSVSELIYYLYVSSQTLKKRANFLKNFLLSKYFNKYDLDQVEELYRLELKSRF